MRIRNRRILPATCPSSSFPGNLALASASITSPSNSTLSSFATELPSGHELHSRPVVRNRLTIKLPASGIEGGHRSRDAHDGSRAAKRRAASAGARRGAAGAAVAGGVETAAFATTAVVRRPVGAGRLTRFGRFGRCGAAALGRVTFVVLRRGFFFECVRFGVGARLAGRREFAVERLVGDRFFGRLELLAGLAFLDG